MICRHEVVKKGAFFKEAPFFILVGVADETKEFIRKIEMDRFGGNLCGELFTYAL